MDDTQQSRFWNVSLYGQVPCRMEQLLKFDAEVDNVSVACEEAALADPTGTWVAIGDSAIELAVTDEHAVQDITVPNAVKLQLAPGMSFLRPQLRSGQL